MNKRFYKVIAVLLIITGTAVGAYAALQNSITLRGTLSTGHVEIELTEAELPTADKEAVTPGKVIEYIPQITAKGADCYVRLTVDIQMDRDTPRPLCADDITVPDGWIWKGDTLYLTRPVAHGETVDAAECITIPDWTNETAADFRIELTADAIQSTSFEPDFVSENPWGTVEIREHKEGSVKIGTAEQAKPGTITYVGSGLFEVPSGDLFADFPEMLPGDTASDFIMIKNGTDNAIELSFKNVPQQKALLDEVGMKLSIGGREFYDGTLDGQGMEEQEVLTRLNAGESTRLDYEINLPTDFENEFSLEADVLSWQIKAQEDAPKTGDSFPLYAVSIMLIISGGLMLLLCRRKRA